MTEKNLVYKDNRIVEASYKLSLTEQRIVLLAISQVNSEKKLTENEVFTITALEYSTVFSISKDEAFREMKKAMKSLSERWVKVIDDGNTTEEISWISKRSSTTSSQSIAIRFSTDISKYLSELTGNFTKYRLLHVSGMSSIYSIRIYETLIRWRSKKSVTMTVDQIKDRLQLTSKGYELFGNIRQKIIDPAMEEIRRCSDVDPAYELIKDGNKVVAVKFYYNFKPGMEPKKSVEAKRIPAIKRSNPGEELKKVRKILR